jgi:hypothetical protein
MNYQTSLLVVRTCTALSDVRCSRRETLLLQATGTTLGLRALQISIKTFIGLSCASGSVQERWCRIESGTELCVEIELSERSVYAFRLWEFGTSDIRQIVQNKVFSLARARAMTFALDFFRKNKS